MVSKNRRRVSALDTPTLVEVAVVRDVAESNLSSPSEDEPHCDDSSELQLKSELQLQPSTG